MAEVEYTNGRTTDKDADLSSHLPSTLPSPSFFVYDSPDHTTVVDYFVRMTKVGDTNAIDDLLASPFLTESSVSLPSLLARVWISPSHPVHARLAALQQYITLMQNQVASQDFQGFIPHLIAVLADSNKDVRAAGANAILAYEASLSKLSSKAIVVGLDDMYTEDVAMGGLKWLALPERKWLVESVITPKLEECRLDGKY